MPIAATLTAPSMSVCGRIAPCRLDCSQPNIPTSSAAAASAIALRDPVSTTAVARTAAPPILSHARPGSGRSGGSSISRIRLATRKIPVELRLAKLPNSTPGIGFSGYIRPHSPPESTCGTPSRKLAKPSATVSQPSHTRSRRGRFQPSASVVNGTIRPSSATSVRPGSSERGCQPAPPAASNASAASSRPGIWVQSSGGNGINAASGTAIVAAANARRTSGASRQKVKNCSRCDARMANARSCTAKLNKP